MLIRRQRILGGLKSGGAKAPAVTPVSGEPLGSEDSATGNSTYPSLALNLEPVYDRERRASLGGYVHSAGREAPISYVLWLRIHLCERDLT